MHFQFLKNIYSHTIPVWKYFVKKKKNEKKTRLNQPNVNYAWKISQTILAMTHCEDLKEKHGNEDCL